MYRAAFVAFVLASQAVAADPVGAVNTTPSLKLPAQIVVAPGQPFRIVAETNCRAVRWSGPAVVKIPDEWLRSDVKQYAGIAPSAPTTFKVNVLGSLNDQWVEAFTLVIVGTQPDNPPDNPPAPTDTLAAELQKLFTADKGTAPTRDRLCELWTSAVAQVRDNPEHTTIADFAKAMHATSAKFPFSLTDSDLRGVRSRLAAELASACGGNAVALGAPRSECRMKAAGVLERFAVALGQCR